MHKGLIIGCFLISNYTYAELTEIPPEKLTNSYIKDTTIIVEQKKPEPETAQEMLKDDLHIEVSPQSYSSAKQTEQKTLPKIANNPEMDLQQHFKPVDSPVLYQFLKQQQTKSYDPQAQSTEKKLRKQFNIPYNQPIDFANINLPTSENGKYNLGASKGYSVGKKSLEIRIPNTSGYKAQTIQSADNTFSVEVTASDLIFKFNLK